MIQYDPQDIEPKWQRYWREKKTFKRQNSAAEKSHLHDLFPLLNDGGFQLRNLRHCIANDTLARYKKMNGFSILGPLESGSSEAQSGLLNSLGLGFAGSLDASLMPASNPAAEGPIAAIKEYGADSARLSLLFMCPINRTRIRDSNAVLGSYRFARRVWNLYAAHARRGFANFCAEHTQKELNRLIGRVTEHTETHAFNRAVAAFMEFINRTSMDSMSKKTLEVLAVLLSPYAPHLAEEAWEILGNTPCVANCSWPSYDPMRRRDEAVNLVIQVNGKKRAGAQVPADSDGDIILNEVKKALSSSPYFLRGSERLITVFQEGTKVPRLVNVVTQEECNET